MSSQETTSLEEKLGRPRMDERRIKNLLKSYFYGIVAGTDIIGNVIICLDIRQRDKFIGGKAVNAWDNLIPRYYKEIKNPKDSIFEKLIRKTSEEEIIFWPGLFTGVAINAGTFLISAAAAMLYNGARIGYDSIKSRKGN